MSTTHARMSPVHVTSKNLATLCEVLGCWPVTNGRHLVILHLDSGSREHMTKESQFPLKETTLLDVQLPVGAS